MFSDPTLDHNFHTFVNVPGLYIYISRMWQLSTHLKYGKVLEYTF